VSYDYVDISDSYNINTHAYSPLPTYPGAAPHSTEVFAMNNSGEIVGDYHPVGGFFQGFSYSGGAFASVNPFGANYSYAVGVSNNGQIVGTFGVADAGGNVNSTQGYLYSSGQYTVIDGTPYPANSTSLTEVNNSGNVVGASFSSSSPATYSFLYVGGVYTRITMPGEQDTSVNGINDAGVIVGEASNDGYVTGTGFVDDHGVFTAVNVPGASATVVNDINNLGQIVGDYVDRNGNYQAFVATPTPAVPEPATWALMAAGFAGIVGAGRRGRRVSNVCL
jgi:uncharacterized membrane protein